MSKIEVSTGDNDFDGIICDLDDEPVPSNNDEMPTGEQQTRLLVVKTVLLAGTAALAVTGVYGLWTGDWLPVGAVWALAAAPIGAILVKYLGKSYAVKTALDQ